MYAVHVYAFPGSICKPVWPSRFSCIHVLRGCNMNVYHKMSSLMHTLTPAKKKKLLPEKKKHACMQPQVLHTTRPLPWISHIINEYNEERKR